MASKRASTISDCLSDVEQAFFQAGQAEPAADVGDDELDAGPPARSFWSRLLGRLRR